VLRRALFGLASCVLAFTATSIAAQQTTPVAGPLYVVVRIEVLPGNDITAVPLLKQYVLETRRVPGGMRTELLKETRGPVYTIIEVWRDAAAYQSSLATASMVRLRSRIRTLIGAELDVREIHVLVDSLELPTMAPAYRPNGQSVYVVTYLDFLPAHANRGTAALRRYGLASRREPGSIRLEMLQETASNHFVIVEVWHGTHDYERHLGTPMTLRFRHEEATRPWIGAPYGSAVSRLVL
jgi:quinol monooxygenase YgiN